MKVKISVSTDKIGSGVDKIIDIDDEDFEDMDETEIERHIEEVVWEHATMNMIFVGWEKL